MEETHNTRRKVVVVGTAERPSRRGRAERMRETDLGDKRSMCPVHGGALGSHGGGVETPESRRHSLGLFFLNNHKGCSTH